MAVNDYYIELPIKNILKEGRTTKPELCGSMSIKSTN